MEKGILLGISAMASDSLVILEKETKFAICKLHGLINLTEIFF